MDLLLDRLLPLLSNEGASDAPDGSPRTLTAHTQPEERVVYRLRLGERIGRFERH